MCAADINLEPINIPLGGVTGWDGDRKCRNFSAVHDFAERWKWKAEAK